MEGRRKSEDEAGGTGKGLGSYNIMQRMLKVMMKIKLNI